MFVNKQGHCLQKRAAGSDQAEQFLLNDSTFDAGVYKLNRNMMSTSSSDSLTANVAF